MASSSELLQLVRRAKKDKETLFKKDVGDESGESDGEIQHEELLQKVKSLGRKKQEKRHKGPIRSEPSQQVSEFNLKSGKQDKINLEDLVGSLQNSSYHGSLKKTLESMQRMGKTVEAPVAKPVAERIQRAVAYKETAKDITKWQPVIQKNRQAEHLSFPLNAVNTPQISTGILSASFKPQTPLELEIANVLQQNSNLLERNNKELSHEEEKALQTMSLEEALERRNELRKLRFLQSHYEQKCRRMKKIKSKKYHRIKRKSEKRATSKLSFEQLQKENPELAEKELNKAEQLRIQERMSLKHRNTSKWAKNLITKGIKDVEAKQALAEQLRISRQLTETKKELSESEDESCKKRAEEESDDIENIRNFALLGDNSNNPWLLSKKMGEVTENHNELGERRQGKFRKLESIEANETSDENHMSENDEETVSEQEETFVLMDHKELKSKVKRRKKMKGKQVSGIDKTGNIEEEQNGTGKRAQGKKKRISTEEQHEVNRKNKKMKVKQEMVEEKNELPKKKKKRKKLKIEDSEVNETFTNTCEDNQGQEVLLNETDGTHEINISSIREDDTAVQEQREQTSLNKTNVNLDPKKVFQIEDDGRNLVLNLVNDDDDDDENLGLNTQRMSIQEAFANDDVIEEFVKEKTDLIEAGKPKDIDTCLPGWGDWAGPGIEQTQKNRKREVQQKPGSARKDSKLVHVIINEERDKKFAKNQVSVVPYPYTSREQWERSIRGPLGKHWNTMSVHKKLIQPRVNTLPGTIIEPMQPTKDMKQTKDNNNKQKRSKSTLKIIQ